MSTTPDTMEIEPRKECGDSYASIYWPNKVSYTSFPLFIEALPTPHQLYSALTTRQPFSTSKNIIANGTGDSTVSVCFSDSAESSGISFDDRRRSVTVTFHNEKKSNIQFYCIKPDTDWQQEVDFIDCYTLADLFYNLELLGLKARFGKF